ncbi:MAG: diaminopimelate epimerase [Planctomycetota bacterium]|jgi:diaminopimelate epimerase
MKADFIKYHGLGNDYLVIDPNACDIELTPEVIRLICDRHFGVGSDGILYGPLKGNEVLKVRIFNPDGSEAEKSGNGLRIFAKYLLEQGYAKESKFSIETLGGLVKVEIMDPSEKLIKINMGTITFISDEIPVKGKSREVINEELQIGTEKHKVICLSIGNPHCVIPMEDISAAKAKELGPHVEHHELFPSRINMQLLKIIDRNNIEIQIWERGAGYTLASGSSCCAAAGAAYKLGMVDEEVNVKMPGGQLLIHIGPDMEVEMTGSVEKVFEGYFLTEFKNKIRMR